MRLICINNYSLEIGTTASITLGKIYESIESFSFKDYFITNDSGFKSWEQKENFITLEEFREQKLKELGI